MNQAEIEAMIADEIEHEENALVGRLRANSIEAALDSYRRLRDLDSLADFVREPTIVAVIASKEPH